VARLFLEAGKVLGVDIVAEFVARAVEKGVEARVADVTRDGLPFPEAEIDVVYAGALIEHLYDPEFFLRECHRVLAAEGVIVLSAPNIASLTSRLRMLLGRGPKFYTSALSWPFGGHIRIFTARTLQRLLEENGFALEELTSNLRRNGFTVTDQVVLTAACINNYIMNTRLSGGLTAAVVLACEAGWSSVKQRLPDKNVVKGTKTMGLVIADRNKGVEKLMLAYADYKDKLGNEYHLLTGELQEKNVIDWEVEK